MSGRRSLNKQGSRIVRGGGQVFESKLLPDLEGNLEGHHLSELAELESFFGMDAAQLAESVSEMFSQSLSPRHDVGTRPATAISVTAAADDTQALAASPMHGVSNKASESPRSPPEPSTEPLQASSPIPPPSPSPKGTFLEGAFGDASMEATRTNRSVFSAQSARANSTQGSPRLDSASRQISPNASFESAARGTLSSRRRAMDARRMSLCMASEALANITAIEMPRTDRQGYLQNLHRPVTPRELAEASIPRPLQMPPIFKRSTKVAKEPHYSYFDRKLPGESPEHRRVMWGKAACTRKVYHFNEIVSSDP